MVKKRIKILIIVLIPFVSLFLIQGCIKKIMDSATFQISPSHVLPSSAGLTFEEITIESGLRKTRAWFIPATQNKSGNNLVLLFNGIGGNLSGWIKLQKYFSENGIASVSFEYGPQSDTTNDKGSSRLEDVTKDVNTIINKMTLKLGKDIKLFLLGHSVGNAVLLEMYPDVDASSIAGVIICNAFASMKGWGIQHGKIPGIFSFVIPDYYDNVENIKKVKSPVLIVHSKVDTTNFFNDALVIYNSANSPKQFVEFKDYQHNDIFKVGNFEYWLPIVEFIKIHSVHK